MTRRYTDTSLTHRDEEGKSLIMIVDNVAVNIQIPVQDFTVYLGLEGSITSVIKANNILYVSTNEGLFYLTKVKSFEEVDRLIKKEHKRTTFTQTYRTIKSINKIVKVTFQGSDEFSDGDGSVTKEIPLTIQIPIDSVSTSIREEFINQKVRKEYAMQSIPFVFKGIKGIKGKCRQLLKYKDKIIVASNVGLFEVSNIKSVPIIKDIYINCICVSGKYPGRFYVGTNSGFYTIIYEEDSWKIIDKSENINVSVLSIEEEEQKLWLGCENQIYKVALNERGKIIGFILLLQFFYYFL